MRLGGQVASLRLTGEGSEILPKAGLPREQEVALDVRDADDVGIWVQIERDGGQYFLLIRWQYILSVEFPVGPRRRRGLRT